MIKSTRVTGSGYWESCDLGLKEHVCLPDMEGELGGTVDMRRISSDLINP